MEIEVGVPTYNNEGTMERTLRMLFEQSRKPDRILMCDKSSDDTKQIAKQVASEYETPFKLLEQEGKGVADAYNQIMSNLEEDTDVLATLQTNLYVEKDWLQNIEKGFQETDADIISRGLPSNEPDDKNYLEKTPDEHRGYWEGRNGAIKVEKLKQVGGWDENFLRGEDWDFRIRLDNVDATSYALFNDLAIYSPRINKEPYVNLGKARNKPTSLTFLAKYGRYYLKYSPKHILGDISSLATITTTALAVLFLALNPTISLILAAIATANILIYFYNFRKLRSNFDLEKATRSHIFNGIALFYAAKRILTRDREWNKKGFSNN